MSSRPFALPTSSRRLLPRVLLCLSLALAMVAAPWWQQALARNTGAADLPAMAICSVGNASGNAPSHLAAAHCQLCCGGQWQAVMPAAGFTDIATSGISYPAATAIASANTARRAPGNPRARAPPVA